MKKFCLLLLALLTGLHPELHAAIFSVTTTSDGGPGSLRQAILSADSNIGPDIVTFAITGTIDVFSQELTVADDLTLLGPGPDQLSISGHYSINLISIGSDVTLRLSGLKFEAGYHQDDDGAAISVPSSSLLIIDNCLFQDNDSGEGFGGAISSRGDIAISNSSFIDNFASAGGAIESSGALNLTNCTFSGNSSFYEGGAIQCYTGQLINLTISKNTANLGFNEGSGYGGGISISGEGAAARLINCIIAGNFNATAAGSGEYDDSSGWADGSSINNLIGDGSFLNGISHGTNGNQIGDFANPIDPLLAGLQFNGGSTPTHNLLPGSPAIDNGNNALAPPADQRGIPRPQGAQADIGAVEYLASPGTITVTVTTTNNDGPGSLRQAILDANVHPGPDIIEFNIPGPGPHTISPSSTLPAITDTVDINGYSQPGATTGPLGENVQLKIEIDGSFTETDSGLTFLAGDCTLRGLAINGFPQHGVRLSSSGNNIHGNFIGTSLSGLAAIPNRQNGIAVFGSHNRIGGPAAGQGNLISGNDYVGVLVGGESSGNIIQGNYVGTDITGTNSIPNDEGIVISGSFQTRVGGSGPNEGNVVSGNFYYGIVAYSSSSQTTIQGNIVGADPSGQIAVPNYDGIVLLGSNNLVGGPEPLAPNLISGNDRAGVSLLYPGENNRIEANLIGLASDLSPLGNGAAGIELTAIIGGGSSGSGSGGEGYYYDYDTRFNRLTRNRIFANGGLGIDINDDGVTPNDPGDFDSGHNDKQNYPLLAQAVAYPGSITVSGSYSFPTNAEIYDLEFFASPAADPSGFGQGRTYLGTHSVPGGDDTFTATLPVTVTPGQVITATATSSEDNTSEFSQAVTLHPAAPPVITVQPASLQPIPGHNATFCVTAEGQPPLSHQWRRNGVNIPGANSPCLTVVEAEITDGGPYTVVIGNEFGTVTSEPALLTFDIEPLPPGDNFADRVSLTGPSGTATGSNQSATKESGEPNHASKPGGPSVWYTWQAPATGIATFTTAGSFFDTLLAAYTGSSVDTLTLVAADEDSGPSLTSRIRFNATAGTQYHFAIDGFGAAEGNFLLNWTLEVTPDQIPLIVTQPESRTVAPGTNHTFVVTATSDGNAPLTYQWHFNDTLIPGATNTSLLVASAGASTVGQYHVVVSSGSRSARSLSASLQINQTGPGVLDVLSEDKYLDAVRAENPIRLGGATGTNAPPQDGGTGGGGALSLGYTGTQTFNTHGASSEPGEPNHCDVPGGASQWFVYLADQAGSLFLNTDGSEFDTVLAVYTGDGVSMSSLDEQACDNNNGLDGIDSSLSVPVQPGLIYFIVVDGVGGATGLLTLNYNLVVPSTLTPMTPPSPAGFDLRLVGRAGMNFTVQFSVDLVNWIDILTTTSPSATFDFTTPPAPGRGAGFYRAVMLP